MVWVKINGEGGQNKQGVGKKYKREETKIGLSLNSLLTSLNIGILVYCGATYVSETPRI